MIEDCSDDDHITEHMCVTDFTDMLDRGHRRNYASSAYLAALDSSLHNESFSFERSDFAQALSELTFVEVVRVEIMEESKGVRSKLFEVLSSAMKPVPGDEFCLVYHPCFLSGLPSQYNEDDDPDSLDSFNDEDRGVVKNVEEEDASVLQSNHQAGLLDDSSSNISVSTASTIENNHCSIQPVPVLVKFLVDDELVSVQDLKELQGRASIAALLSLYNEDPDKAKKSQPKRFPQSHVSAISDLSWLLNAHVGKCY